MPSLPPMSPPFKLALMLLACVLLLTACAAPQPLPPVVVTPPRVPPLAPEAKQPEPPPICRPTCSGGLVRLLESLLPPPTKPASLELPASGPTKP